MPWPLSQDYNEAIQNAQTSFADPELRAAEVVTNALGIPLPRSGNFADVYEIRGPAGRWAVKCFTREVPGLRERYAEISAHLRRARLPFAVEFTYLDEGIRVQGRWYPVLKMQWVEGQTLNEFVRNSLDRPAALEALLQIWARMARRLREADIGHGDLQHGNVLLVPGRTDRALAVKLIDYDGMWVPALAGRKSGEVGHPAYQHPQRLREGAYFPDVDRFSLLLIATALRAVAAGGRPLWERFDNGDNLLFREADLRAPANAEVFRALAGLEDKPARELTSRLLAACQQPLGQVPILDEVLGAAAALPPEDPPPLPVEAKTVIDTVEPLPVFTAPARKAPLINLRVAVAAAALAVIAVGFEVWWVSSGKNNPAGPPEDPVVQAPTNTLVEKEEPRQVPDKPEVKPEGAPVVPRPPDVQLAKLPEGPAGLVRSWPNSTGGMFAPDGGSALIFGKDTPILLWDLIADQPVRSFRQASGAASSGAFSADGRLFLAAGGDQEVRLWDVAAGKVIAHLTGHVAPPTVLGFTADGSRGYTWSWGPREKACLVWDLRHERRLRAFLLRPDVAFPLALHGLSADGGLTVATGYENGAKLLNTENGQEVRPLAHPGQVHGGALTPDGKLVLTCGEDGAVRVWDATTGEQVRAFFGHKGPVHAAAFTPDGRRAASAGTDQLVRVWDRATGRELHRFRGHSGLVRYVTFSPDGRHLLSAADDKLVRLLRLPADDSLAMDDKPAEILRLEGHEEEVRGVALARDGNRAITGSGDQTVRLWDLRTGKEIRKLGEHAEQVHAVALTPDGTQAISGDQEGNLRVLDMASGNEVRRLVGHSGRVLGVAVSPDGRLAASGGADQVVWVWKLATGKLLRRLAGHTAPITSLRFTPDGRGLISASDDATIRLWDVALARESRRFDGHAGTAWGTDITSDARFLASAGKDRTVRLWELADGRELQRFDGLPDAVQCVAFSPDGRYVVAGLGEKDEERVVRVWDLTTRKEVPLLLGPTFDVISMAFTPDGRLIAAGKDKSVRVYRLFPKGLGQPTDPLAALARSPAPSAAAQADAEKQIKEAFKEDYMRRQPADMQALARRLLDEGRPRSPDAAKRFVLLREACDLAARAGNAPLALEAVDETVKHYAVAAFPLKATAVEAASKVAVRPADCRAVAEAALGLLDQARSADDYESAAGLLAAARKSAQEARIAALLARVTALGPDLDRLRKEYAAVRPAFQALATDPSEPNANLAVGQFLCLHKNDWARGQALLAAGGDDPLAVLAAKEMSAADPAGVAAAGFAWWDRGETLSGSAQASVRGHARTVLRRALPGLAGAELARAQDRLKVTVGAFDGRPGLVLEVYQGRSFDKRAAARLDYAVNADWGADGPPGSEAGKFSVRWRGWLVPPKAGKYTLVVNASDGCRLVLDGKIVVESWTAGGRHARTVTLNERPVSLRVELNAFSGPSSIVLSWSLEGGFGEQPVPTEALYHDAKEAQTLTPVPDAKPDPSDKASR